MDARVRKAVDRELHKNLGMNPISSEDGVGIITIKLEEYALNPHGVFHGGIIYLICDVCAYFGLLSILDEGLDAVDPIFLANLIDRLQPLQRLKTDLGLELRAVNLAFLFTHKLLLIISGNSLNHCLKYGVHYR